MVGIEEQSAAALVEQLSVLVDELRGDASHQQRRVDEVGRFVPLQLDQSLAQLEHLA